MIFLIAYVRIIQKAGYSGWWVLVGLVPILNLVMFLVFAFSRWPVLRERDALHEVRPNSGGSMADAVNRIEAALTQHITEADRRDAERDARLSALESRPRGLLGRR